MLIPLLLSLFVAAQASPAHAELHPLESDLYLELGDVSGFLTELDKAPIVRFLRDERIAGLLEGLGFQPNRPARELVQDGLAKILPGGIDAAWLSGLRTASASVVALGPRTDSTPAGALLAVLDYTTPEQAGAVRSILIGRASKHESVSSTLEGVELLHMGDKAREDVWCATVGSRLVLGDVASKLEDYLARSEKKLAGLAGSEAFGKRLAALEKASGTPVLWFALAGPLQGIVAKMQSAGDAGLATVGRLPDELNPFGSALVARMQLAGERFVTEMISSTDAAPSKPIDPAWLEPVPPGSMIVYSSAFDGAAAGKRLRKLLAKDEQAAASLTALEERLGFGPERVLAHLGPGMTVYAAPLAGLGLPETRVWIDCDDAAAFTSEYEALFNALGETMPGLQVKTKPYKLKKSGSEEGMEVPITTLSLPSSWQQLSMLNPAPSFAPVGKKLVFALGSMEMRSELKRVHGVSGEPIVPGSNPLGAYGFQMPAEARSLVVMDWGRLFGSVVGMIKAFAPMMGAESWPFDYKKLPPPEIFTQYFKPTFHYTKSAADGLYRRNEASFGPETWLGLGALWAHFMTGVVGDLVPGKVPASSSSGGGQ